MFCSVDFRSVDFCSANFCATDFCSTIGFGSAFFGGSSSISSHFGASKTVWFLGSTSSSDFFVTGLTKDCLLAFILSSMSEFLPGPRFGTTEGAITFFGAAFFSGSIFMAAFGCGGGEGGATTSGSVGLTSSGVGERDWSDETSEAQPESSETGSISH